MLYLFTTMDDVQLSKHALTSLFTYLVTTVVTLSFLAIAYELPNHPSYKWGVRRSTLQGYLSLFMRKPAYCICENKDADQLRGNREADQRLCFRYTDSTIPLLPKSEISSLYLSSVAVQPGLCWTCLYILYRYSWTNANTVS